MGLEPIKKANYLLLNFSELSRNM